MLMGVAWPTKKLKDLADIRVSNVDKKVQANEKAVKLCNYMDVYSNEYISSRIQFMEGSASTAEIERFGLKCGDVIITKDSETPDDIGIPTVIVEAIDDLVCGYHLALIRPNTDQLDPIYLAKQLSTSHVARYFALHASGSTRYGLPISVIESTEIPTPPKPEQTKIAEILSKVDRAIEQTEALIAKHRRIKTGLMQDLLTCGIDEKGHLRSERTHKFKDSPLGRIPVEWEVLSLGEVAAITRLAGYEYSTYWLPVENGEIITLRGYNIGKNKIIERDLERISDRLSQRLIRSRLFKGDVVFPCVGSIGNAALIREDDRYHINQNIAKITPGSQVEGSYLVHYLMSELCRIEIDRFNASSSQPNVLVGSLRQFRVPIPSDLKEQRSIAEKLNCHDAATDQESERLAKLRALKTALIQDLLTGKRRVMPLPNDPEVIS